MLALISDGYTGHARALGNHFSSQISYAAWSTPYGHGENMPLVPRQRWAELIAKAGDDGPESPYLPPVHDQGGIGQCNPEAVTGALEYCRAMQGLPYVRLSAADLYDRINGGLDGGSLLEDALDEVTRVGVGTAMTCGQLWGPLYRRATAAERARFRVLEYFLCPSFSHCMSAVLERFAIVSGVPWWDDYRPDLGGWMPTHGRGSSGGHAMFGYKATMRPTRRGPTQWGIWHQGSFGSRWGPCGGRCVLSEASFTSGVGGWWAVRQVVSESPAPVASSAGGGGGGWGGFGAGARLARAAS